MLGQISAEQASLSRQAAIIVGDGRKVLATLQPFAPQAETDIVEALRALVANSLNRLEPSSAGSTSRARHWSTTTSKR